MSPDVAPRLVHPARPGDRAMRAEVLWSLPRVGRPEVAPGGAHLAVPVGETDEASGKTATALWWVPSRGGFARRLTTGERDVGDPAIGPEGRRLAFTTRPRPQRGEEPAPPQIAVLPLDGGEADVLTDLPLGAFDPRWMPDGSGLVFGAWLYDGHLDPEATREEHERRKRDGATVHATEDRFYRFWDRWLVDGKLPHLFALDLASREIRDLMPTSTLAFEWLEPAGSYEIAPDGREILVTGIANRGVDGRPRRDVYRLALDRDEPELLTGQLPHNAFGARYAEDGASFVFGMTVDPDFYADRTRLARYDLRSGAIHPVLEDWDRSPTAWRFLDANTLVFAAEDEGTQRLYRLSLGAAPGGRPEPFTRGGTFTGPRPAGPGHVVALHHDLSNPPEIARVDVATGEMERITAFAAGRMGDVRLGEVLELAVEGAAGETIQTYVVLPPDFEEGTRRPLVHLVHGGPHGTFGDTWHWRWHAHCFAAGGHVVACVNFQGSTSFGQDFAQRIQGSWGDRPATDVHRATDRLAELGWIDGDRVAVAGGSYGGYLTAWLASTSDRFRCAVNHAGVYDLGFQYGADVNFSWHRASGGDPWTDPEAVDRWNPARYTAGLATPMLVVHGEKDYRVPVGHALLCYGILKAKGVPARLVYFEDENHWILKRENSLRWYEEVLGWLARWLDS